MAKGPIIDLNAIEMHNQKETGFRITTAYQTGLDEYITRLDVKVFDVMYSVAIASTNPIAPIPGSKNTRETDMITPKTGIEYCLNLKVSKPELLRALKELVSDLENS